MVILEFNVGIEPLPNLLVIISKPIYHGTPGIREKTQ